jgi:hypothetical protein
MALEQVSIQSFLTGLATLAGLSFGLYQYWNGQRLQRAKFAAELVDKLYNDGELRAAWSFIDWQDGEVALPPKYSETGSEPLRFAHNFARLRDAMSMRNRSVQSNGYTELRSQYRKRGSSGYIEYVEIFDRFFAFVDGVYGYYLSNSIELKHISHILYLLERLDQMELDQAKIFEEYLVYYDYDNVIYMITVARMFFARRRQLFLLLRARRQADARISFVRNKLKRILPSPPTSAGNAPLIPAETSAP